MDGVSKGQVPNIFTQMRNYGDSVAAKVIQQMREQMPSVFKTDGFDSAKPGSPFAHAMYGVFPSMPGIGTGIPNFPQFPNFPGMPDFGQMPGMGGNGPISSAMYGVFPGAPGGGCGGSIEGPGSNGPGAVAMYGVFAGGGCGAGIEGPSGPQGPGAVAMYGVFPGAPGGSCGGGLEGPTGPQVPGATAMYGVFAPGDCAGKAQGVAEIGQKGDTQSAQALTKLAEMGAIDIDDLTTRFNNGEFSGMTSRVAEQIINNYQQGQNGL